MKMIRLVNKVLHSRFTHRIFVLAIIVISIGIISTITFAARCGSTQKNFRPINEPKSAAQMDPEASIPNYNRTEETTYLTFPEWYLVFNPQEYGMFLTEHRASRFPYFGSIKQVWSGYCEVYGITKNNYKFNLGNHVVESVIVTSFTIEYIAKGIYENTVGRISELFAMDEQTEEEIYAARVATEYGAFVPTEPWYAFPFGEALSGLWTKTSFFGPHIVRKMERKFALSLEYGVKMAYAKIITLATRTAFGIANTEIHARVKNISEETFLNPKIKKIKKLDDQSYIVTIPHYQGFTDTVPTLAEAELEFIDIAGNDEILITIVAPNAWAYNLSYGSELFSTSMLTDLTKKRIAIQAPVKNLSQILRQLKFERIIIEHLYDY